MTAIAEPQIRTASYTPKSAVTISWLNDMRKASFAITMTKLYVEASKCMAPALYRQGLPVQHACFGAQHDVCS
jgi:hypothetical protein